MLESNPSADPGRRMPQGFALGFFSFFGLNALNSCLLSSAFLPFVFQTCGAGLVAPAAWVRLPSRFLSRPASAG